MAKLVYDQSGEPIQALYQGTVQNVSIAATSAKSAAFGGITQTIRIVADVDCFYLIGADPTASSSNGSELPAGVVEIVGVKPGQKIAVIRKATDGNLNITEGGDG